MSGPNDSPGSWGENNFGTIYYHNGSRVSQYRFTPIDVVLLVGAAAREERYHYLPLWCMIQRFGQQRMKSGNNPPPNSLSVSVYQFSAPVNPLFAYTGDPTPARATIRCRDGGGGNGRVESIDFPQHNFSFNPARARWDVVMCSRGASPIHGNDRARQDGSRRRRLGQIVRAAFENDHAAYQSADVSVNSAARIAVWNLVHAAAGNPIPGFDNFAACWAFPTVIASGRYINIADMTDPVAIEQAMARVRGQSSSDRATPSRRIMVRLGRGHRSAAQLPTLSPEQMTNIGRSGLPAGTEGRNTLYGAFYSQFHGGSGTPFSNCYFYREGMGPSDRCWIEWNGVSSEDQTVDQSHRSGHSISLGAGQTRGAATTTTAATTAVAAGNTGERSPERGGSIAIPVWGPEGSSNYVQSQVPQTDELISRVRNWASRTERELNGRTE